LYISEQRAREAWRRHRQQALGPGRRQAKNVTDVEVTGCHPIRQRPPEAVQQVGQAKLHRVRPQLHPGARPPPVPERQVPEVAADAGAGAGEPRGAERVGVLPVPLVAAHGPDVDPDAGVARDGVPAHGAVLEALAVEQRQRRVQPEHLLADAPEVGQLLHVALVHLPVETHHAGELVLRALQLAGAPQELHHAPLQRRRHGLCAAEHDVLHAIAIAMSIYVSSSNDDD